MKTIEMTARNVDEAIENGLKELQVEKSKVDIEILEQGAKGLFGFGAKPAKVKLTLRFDYELTAKAFLRDVLNKMDIKCEIHIKDNEDNLKINLIGPDMGLLIGYRGETLDALQYLVSLVINKDNKEAEYKRVILDTENYRKKREETLIRLANKLAYKAQKYRKSIALEPMNPYERRIIHSALQNHPNVTTHSEGDEPYRKVVIDIKD